MLSASVLITIGERACMSVSSTAWLQALHDGSSNNSSRRSWKGAGVVISSAGAFCVSGKIARRHLTLVAIRSNNDEYLFVAEDTQAMFGRDQSIFS